MKIRALAAALLAALMIALTASCARPVSLADLAGYWHEENISCAAFYLEGDGRYTFYSPYGEETAAGRCQLKGNALSLLLSDGFVLESFTVRDKNTLFSSAGATYLRSDQASFFGSPSPRSGNAGQAPLS